VSQTEEARYTTHAATGGGLKLNGDGVA